MGKGHSKRKGRGIPLELKISCDMCPRVFGSANAVTAHVKSKHTLAMGFQRYCRACGNGFIDKVALQAHRGAMAPTAKLLLMLHRNEEVDVAAQAASGTAQEPPADEGLASTEIL